LGVPLASKKKKKKRQNGRQDRLAKIRKGGDLKELREEGVALFSGEEHQRLRVGG